MARLSFAAPTDVDVEELAVDLREADRIEIGASHGADVRRTIRYAVRTSPEPWAVRSSDGLLCIFGIAVESLLDGSGAPWMLGTPLLDGRHRTLGLVARRYLAEMSRVYAVLTNQVDARNAASIRLLEWLGFDLGEPEPFGVSGLPFRRFEMRGG